MSHPARINLAATQPDGIVVAEITVDDGRLVTGLEAGPGADTTQLADDIWQLADQSTGAIVLDLSEIQWIDSGACAVLIRFWKDLRGKGRALTLSVSDPVRETFRITGLVRLIPCFAELSDAIEAARAAQPTASAGLQAG
jgi:anti-anti-sigma factor